MSRFITFVMFSVAVLAIAGCADSIAPHHPDGGASPGDGGDITPTGNVTTVQVSDRTYTSLINSTSPTDWIYVDFRDGSEAAATAAWDLRFQRFHVSTNGGISGTAGVEISAVTDTAFAAMTAMPDAGYVSDTPDGDDEDTLPEYAFDQGDSWYDYDPETHVLTPRPIVWAVRTAAGGKLKLEILKYYDPAGSAGWFTLHWAPL